MFQRIQTLFLSIVSVSMGILIAMPIWGKIALDNAQSVQITAFKIIHQQGITANITPVWYLALLAGLCLVIAAFTIFQYKNRTLQALLCAINSILMTVLTGLVMYFSVGKAKNLFDTAEIGQFGVGFYALIAAIVANFLANRFIRRDEKFVRSQDRMR
jgi:glucan phosphoethanolaminetransferase (alkaline phosphatase superfamily)